MSVQYPDSIAKEEAVADAKKDFETRMALTDWRELAHDFCVQ